MDTNVVVVTGRLTKDAEISRIGAKDTMKVSFSVANETGYGEYKKTNFLDCDCIGNRFEGVSSYLTKGTKVTVQGEVHQDRWQNNEGQNRSKIKLQIEKIFLLGDRSSGQQNQSDNTGAGVDDDDIPF